MLRTLRNKQVKFRKQILCYVDQFLLMTALTTDKNKQNHLMNLERKLIRLVGISTLHWVDVIKQ